MIPGGADKLVPLAALQNSHLMYSYVGMVHIVLYPNLRPVDHGHELPDHDHDYDAPVGWILWFWCVGLFPCVLIETSVAWFN